MRLEAVGVGGLRAFDEVINSPMRQHDHDQCGGQHRGVQIANSPGPDTPRHVAIERREKWHQVIQTIIVRLRVQLDEGNRNQSKHLRPEVDRIHEHLDHFRQDYFWRITLR